jgi:two-component system cell cycle sensor histidine kinase/response regulator CckA
MKTKTLGVLIVEDSADDFSLLLRELNKSNYEIDYLLVEDAVGFENAIVQNWDVIISDYSLPTFTGFDALKTCVKKEIDTPFIIVSGTVGEDIAVQMMKTGAKDYIMKNSLTRLLPAIERELEDAQIRRERKQVSNALKASEEVYRTLFDQANEGLILMSPDGQFSKINQAFAQMHGYTLDELSKMNIQDLDILKDKALQERAELLRRADAGEVVRFEVDHYRKDGSIFSLSVTVSKINNGNNKLYLSLHQDITERKQVAFAMQKRIEDLEWFNKIAIGRELKMIELKKEVNELLRKMGLEDRYPNH